MHTCSMRNGYRTVLLPLDFSAGSRAAARHLERLLPERTKARIHLVHVLEPLGASPPPPLWEDYNKAREQEARHQLKRTAGQLQRRLHTAAPVQIHVLKGTSYRAICQLAARLGADLIVIGTHGRTGLMHFLLGSVAERVVRHAKCPVLTVPLTPPRGPA